LPPTNLDSSLAADKRTKIYVSSKTDTQAVEVFDNQNVIMQFNVLHRKENFQFVAKIAHDPFEDKESYFQDVEIQSYAKEWAKKFNSYKVPKKVDFIKACIIQLVDRPYQPLCAVERFITGSYRKHNNNYGFVSEDERNTPQAFSHFTHYASGGAVIIVDIQGVGDLYTDPQMHTNLKKPFGKGDLGLEGIEQFRNSHRCNAICRYLGFPTLNRNHLKDDGTLPVTTFSEMAKKVKIVDANNDPAMPLLTRSYPVKSNRTSECEEICSYMCNIL